MNVRKIVLGRQPECYSAGFVRVEGRYCPVIGSEGRAPCYAYVGKEHEPELVLTGPGGMASIYCDTDNDDFFLASQRFFPDFDAGESAIVKSWRDPLGRWRVEEMLKLPFVHRFCLIESEGVSYLVASTICEKKDFARAWSHPGAVYACKMEEGQTLPLTVTPILTGIYQNHGMWKGRFQRRPAVYVTGAQGVFALEPPNSLRAGWRVTRLWDRMVSEISACDIDGDGEQEYALIEPFHGDVFRVARLSKEGFVTLWQYGGDVDFLHVSWGGEILGRPAFIGSCRRNSKELFLLRWNRRTKAMEPFVIDKGCGASSICVAHEGDQCYIAASNREAGEAALYVLTKEEPV